MRNPLARIIGKVGLIAAVSTLCVSTGWSTGASAKTEHSRWVGTYTVTTQGTENGTSTATVSGNGSTTLFSGGSWSASHRVITVDSSSPAPELVCVGAGLTPPCEFVTVAQGKLTATGIGNPKHPGGYATSMFDSSADSVQVGSGTWWAVRTSPNP